ncbi:uncharacterized protein ACR2FA_011493 [Aphomia sociella]
MQRHPLDDGEAEADYGRTSGITIYKGSYNYYKNNPPCEPRDYITVWLTNFTENSFLTCLKNSNNLEIENNSLKEKGIEMLSDTSSLKSIQTKLEGTLLDISMIKSFGYSVKVNLSLPEASKELFFQKITQPLLKTIVNLKTSENKLRYLLRKKGHLREKYDDEGHMKKHNEYEKFFGGSDVPDNVLQKTCSVPHTDNNIKDKNDIKREEQELKIKLEPESQVESQSSTMTTNFNLKKETIKTETFTSSNSKRKRFNLNF